MKKKILLLSPGLDQAIAIARYIKKYSDSFELYGGYLPQENPIKNKRLFAKCFEIKDKRLLNHFDLVLPTGTVSTKWLLSSLDSIRVGEITFLKDNLQCFDKLSLLKRVADLSIPIPETYTDTDQAESRFPLFYKAKHEKITDLRGIAFSKRDIDEINEVDKVFFQELIPTKSTYGMGFLVKNGKLVASFQHEETLSCPIQGGSAVIIKRYYNQRIEEYTKKIIGSLGYEGWGLVEYKFCPKRNDFVFMEINAKFWASIEFTFINDNSFFNHLFKVSYANQLIHRLVFIDRLAVLGVGCFFKNALHLVGSRIVAYHGFFQVLKSLIAPLIPNKIKKTRNKTGNGFVIRKKH